MKTKIIPAINAQNFEEIKEKIELLKNLVNHFHLDVVEKNFTGYQTWQNYYDLDRLEKNLTFDLHLMISLKPQEILKWAKENVKRLILHLEASQNPDGLFKMAKKTKKEIFLAWSPEVEFNFLEKYLRFIDGVLILGVRPGKAGQSFLEETYQRIEFFKNITRNNAEINKNLKKLKLMIDGGVNKENFQKILSYQPDFIVMASAIYNTRNPAKSYLEFIDMTK
jgi:ribulose-phosphate 3-epimerase